MEKGPVYELPAPVPQQLPKKSNARYALLALIPAIYLLSVFRGDVLNGIVGPSPREHGLDKATCYQPDPLFPSKGDEKLDEMYEHISSASFKKHSIERLSGAAQIPTQSFDDLGPIGEDPRWDVMYPFAEYLKKTFPLVHEHMDPEVVNTHGLIYTYKGSESDLKPLLLMAHQDVVPVPNETVSAWTHPPWSGYYDGKSIWGRGASDCKNQLIAVMESMELFLKAGFKPKRTIVLSFGFDEEISGREGAGSLAPYLLDRYGENGLAAIVDEGAGFSKAWGSVFALPGTGEKGYTDVHITVRYPGGHSSIPTDHTSIGILSEIITKIEAEQYPTRLVDENPYLGELQCGAAHATDFPSKLKKLLNQRYSSSITCPNARQINDPLALEAAKAGRDIKYLMQTSQAVDVIRGGIKVNALPERVSVTINHRINIGAQPENVWARLTDLVRPIAKKYDLNLHAFDGTAEAPLSISLTASDTTLRPAPVTPTDGTAADSPFAILAGTTRAVYGDAIIVSPGMTTGNTDTRYYWDLTEHIFRFGPGYDPESDAGLGNIHTVDERVSVENHLGMVRWFVMFVRNLDGRRLSGE